MAASAKARLGHAAVVVGLADAHGFRAPLDESVGVALKAYCDRLLATDEAMDDDDVEAMRYLEVLREQSERSSRRRRRRLVLCHV